MHKKILLLALVVKREFPKEIVKSPSSDALHKINRKIRQVRLLSTIDIKSEEPGLLQASKELGIPLRVVSKSEIATCAKEHSKSTFVKGENRRVGGV